MKTIHIYRYHIHKHYCNNSHVAPTSTLVEWQYLLLQLQLWDGFGDNPYRWQPEPGTTELASEGLYWSTRKWHWSAAVTAMKTTRGHLICQVL